MKVENILESKQFEHDLYLAAKETDWLVESAGDNAVMLMEGAKESILKQAGKYKGSKPPEMWLYQDGSDSSYQVALIAGENTFYRIDILNGRVIEQTPANTFSELIQVRQQLENLNFHPVDTRSWLSKNRRTIFRWILTGALAVALLPLVAALLVVVLEFFFGAAAIASFVGAAAWLSGRSPTGRNL